MTDLGTTLEGIFAQSAGGIALTDPEGRFLAANCRYCEIVGYSELELLDLRMQDITHPDDLSCNLLQFREMVEHQTSFEIEKRYIRKDGDIVWVSNSVSIIKNEKGEVTKAVTFTTDVTDRKRAQEEARQLAAIIASSGDAIISIDLEMKIRSWNKGAETLYGYAADEVIGRPATIILPPDIVDEERIIVERIKTGEHVPPHETRRLRKDGTEVHVSLRVSPIYDENSEVVGASKIARDITERKEAERLQALLVGELTHRVKNVLATVNAIVRQTLGSPEPNSPAAILEARLQTLSKAHDLLTVSNWKTASLGDLVREAMSPYPATRFEIEGEDVAVSARSVLSMTLILHELGTNAAKYGALSVDGGLVKICWVVAPDLHAGEPLLKLHWEELGGPTVTKPSRRGFGTRLIQAVVRSELGGTVAADYAPDGLVCDIQVPCAALNNPSNKSPTRA